MKFDLLSKKEKIYVFTICFFLLFLITFVFFAFFLDINKNSIDIVETFTDWIIYILFLFCFFSFFGSLLYSKHEFTEDFLILRCGIFGFSHIKYDIIDDILLEVDNYGIPSHGMYNRNNNCYIIFGKDNLVHIKLKKMVYFYKFIFFKKEVNEFVISIDKKNLFADTLKEKLKEVCS